MRSEWLPNFLASITIAGLVAGTMAYFDAPTWAWVGIGFFVYLHEVKVPASEVRKRYRP